MCIIHVWISPLDNFFWKLRPTIKMIIKRLSFPLSSLHQTTEGFFFLYFTCFKRCLPSSYEVLPCVDKTCKQQALSSLQLKVNVHNTKLNSMITRCFLSFHFLSFCATDCGGATVFEKHRPCKRTPAIALYKTIKFHSEPK